jgi:SAM-dependent methyltransferase
MTEDEARTEIDESRQVWETKWAAWSGRWRRVPTPVRRACEDQWFDPGTPLLEVGCGTGKTASWLAQEGYAVTAIDFSSVAIEAARRVHSGQPRLTLLEHDMTGDPPPGGPFGALLDWGCLQDVPAGGRKAYVRNLVAAGTEDARLLLFHRTPPDTNPSDVISEVEELLAGEFDLVEAEECMGTSPRGMEFPGVALRFATRRT